MWDFLRRKQFGQSQSCRMYGMLSNVLVFISTNFEILLTTVHSVFDHTITNSGIDNTVINFMDRGQNPMKVENEADML